MLVVYAVGIEFIGRMVDTNNLFLFHMCVIQNILLHENIVLFIDIVYEDFDNTDERTRGTMIIVHRRRKHIIPRKI